MKNRASAVIPIRSMIRRIKFVIKTLKDDKVDLYAAESAFYIILSAIPFLLLLFTAARSVIPDGISEQLYGFAEKLPAGIGDYIKEEISMLESRSVPAPLSLSAFGTLWSASRGVRAVRRGVSAVYGGDGNSGGFIREAVGGLFLTVVFIVLIIALLVFLVFGNTLGGILSWRYPALAPVFEAAFMSSPIVFSVFLVMFFAFVLRAFTPSEIKLSRYRDHISGAAAATVGWILYSYLFSVFVTEFSEASYIYGSLAALMLLFLWLYMIMYILLFGAELNKYLFIKILKNQEKQHKS